MDSFKRVICSMDRRSWPLFQRLLLAAAIWAGVSMACSGCGSNMEQAAPPVDTSVKEAARGLGYSAAAVERGREIYLARCMSCHGPQPLDRYTPQQWRQIVGRMARPSHLDPRQQEDVAAYIEAARQSLVTTLPAGQNLPAASSNR